MAMIINWEEAMNQVGGDVEFLEEVMGDLMGECITSIEDITSGLKAKDFLVVQKAAHRIKGSASYLCCEVLKDIALILQDLGTSGIKSETPEAVWEQITASFVTFKAAVEDVKRVSAEHSSQPASQEATTETAPEVA